MPQEGSVPPVVNGFTYEMDQEKLIPLRLLGEVRKFRIKKIDKFPYPCYEITLFTP
jgi:hypothetical protein